MPATDVVSQPPISARPWQPTLRERFESIWRQHSPRVHSACRGWMRRRPDLVDEAFSRVSLLAFEKYRCLGAEVRNPLGWLLTMTRNVCIDLYREQRRDPVAAAGELNGLGLAAGDDLESRLLGQEMAELCGRWISELPPLQKEALELRLLAESSYQEMAERLGVTQAAARKRVQQARQGLRRKLALYRRAPEGVSRPG